MNVRWRATFVVALLTLACGARTELSASRGRGGGRAGTSTASSSSVGNGGGGEGGSTPTCTPPVEPTTLFSGEEGVRGIAVYGPHLYWTTSSAVQRIPTCGGTPELLADSPSGEAASEIAVTADGVFWRGSGRSIRRVSHGGGDVTTIANDGEIWGLHVDASHVYWYVRPTTQPGGIFRALVGGGAVETLWGSSTSPGYVGPLVGNATAVFLVVGQGSPFGPLRRFGKESSLVTELERINIPAEMTADASALYATFIQSVNEVRRVDAQTGEVTVLATAEPTPQGIAVDASHVYWATSDSEPPAVKRLAHDGVDIEVLVDADLDDPRSLQVDAGALYWGDWASGAVGWMAKPAP